MGKFTKDEFETLFGVKLSDSQYDLMSQSLEYEKQLVDSMLAYQTSAVRSPEEKQAELDRMYNEMGQGMRQHYGTFDTRKQSLTALPFESKTAYTGFEPIIASLFPQQTIGQTRASIEHPTVFSIKSKLINDLDKYYEQLPQADRQANVQAATFMYDDIKAQNPQLSEEQIYDEVVQTINSMQDVPTTSEAQVDPRIQTKQIEDASGLELLGQSFEKKKTAGEDLPNYSPRQYALMKKQQQLKYTPEINKQLIELQRPPAQAEFDPTNPYAAQQEAARYRKRTVFSSNVFKLGPGIYEYVPSEVQDYLEDHPTGGVIYSPEKDTQILEKIKSGDYESGTSINITENKSAREAVARARAYKKLGDPDWRTDLEKRQQVLGNLETYTKEGILGDTIPTGGITETTTGWLLRSAMSPYNTFAAVATPAIEIAGSATAGIVAEGLEATGIIPELEEGVSYFDPLAPTRLREKERPEAYSGYGIVGAIADNIARDKGFVGEGQALAEQLNMEGLAKYATVGGYFVFDILDPSFDLAAGVMKGIGAADQSRKLHKAAYGASNLEESKKAFASAMHHEIDNSLLLDATRTVAKRFNVDIPKVERGDVLLSMGDNVGRTMHYNHMKKHGDNISEVFDDKVVLEMEAKGGPDAFYRQVESNPVTKKMLDEYEDTMGALHQITVRQEIGHAQLLPTEIKRMYPKANMANVNKVKALGHTEASKALSKIYGRNMMFELAPDTKFLDKVQWVTPNTLVHKNYRAKLLAVAAKSDMGEVLNNVIKTAPDDMILAQRQTRTPGFNVFDEDVYRSEQRAELAFDLEKLNDSQINALETLINDLSFPATYKQEVLKNIKDERLLFQGDYNRLRHAIIDKVAELEPQTMSIENVNALTMEQRSRLLEAEGTAYRTKEESLIIKKLVNSSLGKRISDYFARKGFIDRKSLDVYINTPIVQSEALLPTQQQRFLQRMNAERGTINMRAEQLYHDLLENKGDIVQRYDKNYTSKAGVDSVSALGYMIVGEQTDLLGKIQQQVNLEQTLIWIINNIFVSRKEKVPSKYSLEDHVTGANNAYKSGIFNNFGDMYIQQEVRKIAEQIQKQPSKFWFYLNDVIDDINRAIQEPLNRSRTVGMLDSKGNTSRLSKEIVNPGFTQKNVVPVYYENMSDMHSTIMLASYLVAENNRVSSMALNDVLQFEFPDAAVKNILPDSNVSQSMFENSVKDAITILYHPSTYVDAYKLITESVKIQSQIDVVERLAKYLGYEPAINFQKLDQSIIRELRAEAKLHDVSIQKDLKTAKKAQRKKTRRELSERRDFLNSQYKKKQDKIKEELNEEFLKEEDTLNTKMDEEIENLSTEEKTNEDILRLRKIRDSRIKAIQKRLGKNNKNSLQQVRKQRQEYKRREGLLKKKLGKGYTKSKKLKEIEDRYKKQIEDLNKRIQAKFKARKDGDLKVLREQGNKQLETLKQELYEAEVKELDKIKGTAIEEEQLKMIEVQLSMLTTPLEKLQYMQRMTDTYDPMFDEIIDAIEENVVDAEEIDKVVQAVKNAAEVVMRNNDISYSLSKNSLDTLEEMVDSLFRGHGGMARALFGDSDYETLRQKIIETPRQQVRKNIIQAMRKENGKLLPIVNKVIDVWNQTFYVAILGYSPASHGRNTLSGPNIIYQTTGVIFTPELATKGWDAVRYGSNIGSEGYNKIAVRTPDGRVYTNGDIYEGIQKAGVRNQFSYIQSQGGKESLFLREIQDRFTGQFNKPGLQKILRTMNDASTFALALQTKEDFVFRSAAAIKALQEGRSFDEAMQLARRSMFDYSDIPEDVQRLMGAVFVFSSFTVQAMKEIVFSMHDPTKLMQLFKAVDLIKSTETVYQTMNSDVQFPYDMYYPDYAQNRLKMPTGVYGDKVTFAMSYSNPIVDNLNTLVGVGAALFVPDAKDIGAFDPVIQLINPLLKEVLLPKSVDKYTPSNAMPELLFYLELAGNKTPIEIATALEELAGGRVIPAARPEGTKGVRNGYVYPLSEEQQFQLYHRSWYTIFNTLGMTSRLRSIARLVSPEGTTYGGESSGLLILGQITGAYTLSQVDTEDKQQMEALKRREAYLRAIINGEEGMTEAAIYRDQELLYQPSEER